jgi:hypothetical protein
MGGPLPLLEPWPFICAPRNTASDSFILQTGTRSSAKTFSSSAHGHAHSCQVGVPGGREAEGDGVVVGLAGEGAGAVVVGVAVCARARRLEDGGVRRGVARVRRTVRAAAAVPVLPERLACAPARDGAAAAVHLQFVRARWRNESHTVIISRSPAPMTKLPC